MAGVDVTLVTPVHVKCAVLVGFLGAGKTTLLNHLLRQLSAEGKRVGVILNEFAEEFGINNELLATVQSSCSHSEAKDEGEGEDMGAARDTTVEEVFEFGGSCVCCSTGEEFEAAVLRLATKQPPLDFILVETTGRADPAPIAQLFHTSAHLQHRVRLCSITAVVDARNFPVQLQAGDHSGSAAAGDFKNEAECQVVFADTVVLNKRDLVTTEELEAVTKTIRSLNPTATVRPTTRSQLDWETLLSEGQALSEPLRRLLSSAAPSATAWDDMTLESVRRDLNARQASAFKSLYQDHDPDVTALCLAHQGEVQLQPLLTWLREVLPPPPDGRSQAQSGPLVYRMKAVLAVKGNDRRVVLQGVFNSFESTEHRPWSSTEERGTLIVLIGKRLEALRGQWQAVLPTLLQS